MGMSASEKDAIKKMMELPEFEEAIKGQLPSLLQALIDLATGVKVQEMKKNAETGEWAENIYYEKPDRLAAQFLIENVIGKVPTRVELTGKDGEPMKVIPWMPKLIAIEENIIDVLDEEEVALLNEAAESVPEVKRAP